MLQAWNYGLKKIDLTLIFPIPIRDIEIEKRTWDYFGLIILQFISIFLLMPGGLAMGFNKFILGI